MNSTHNKRTQRTNGTLRPLESTKRKTKSEKKEANIRAMYQQARSALERGRVYRSEARAVSRSWPPTRPAAGPPNGVCGICSSTGRGGALQIPRTPLGGPRAGGQTAAGQLPFVPPLADPPTACAVFAVRPPCPCYCKCHTRRWGVPPRGGWEANSAKRPGLRICTLAHAQGRYALVDTLHECSLLFSRSLFFFLSTQEGVACRLFFVFFCYACCSFVITLYRANRQFDIRLYCEEKKHINYFLQFPIDIRKR